MGIGASILLIAIGAILTFALDVTVSGVDLDVVGWILLGAGFVGLVITLIQLNSRRTTMSERRVFDPNNPAGGVVEQQRTTDDGPPAPMR